MVSAWLWSNLSDSSCFLREGNKIVKHSEHLWCESYHEKSFLSYLKLNAEGKRERNNWYQCMLKNTR